MDMGCPGAGLARARALVGAGGHGGRGVGAEGMDRANVARVMGGGDLVLDETAGPGYRFNM